MCVCVCVCVDITDGRGLSNDSKHVISYELGYAVFVVHFIAL